MNSSTQAVSPLRQRMIEDMRLRKLNGKTQLAYVRAVRRLAGFPFAGPAAVLAYLSRYTHRVRAPPQPPNTS